MTAEEAQRKLEGYIAFAPFLTEEAKSRPVWSVAMIAEALRKGPRPNASERFVRDEVDAGNLRAAKFESGWTIYREDLYPWLAQRFLPGSAATA
jgi:hypothetical protein